MKKLLLIVAIAFFTLPLVAQEKTYLMFEFMKVDEEQTNAYWETETFWSKIHEQRAKAGEIQGWDLWSLIPGGEIQGFQYLTVQLFNDPVKMMSGGSSLMAHAKKAYPDMSEYDITSKLRASSKSRDLVVRVFMEIIDQTEDDFEMKVGMITSIDMMKVQPGNSSAYEKAEAEVFKPSHQAMVDAGVKGSWSLARTMFPYGSDTYGTHMTFNFFNDWKQHFDSWNYDGGEISEEQQKKIQDGLATRDMKFVYMGTLEMMARP